MKHRHATQAQRRAQLTTMGNARLVRAAAGLNDVPPALQALVLALVDFTSSVREFRRAVRKLGVQAVANPPQETVDMVDNVL